MSCVALEHLAAAATGDDAPGSQAALVHAQSCARCAVLLDEQRVVRALAGALRRPRLETDRRAELAAEVMARSDALRPRRWRVVAAGFGLVAAAAVMIIATRSRGADELPSIAVADDVPVVRVVDRLAVAESAPREVEASAEIRAGADAELVRETTPERDVITLRGGRVSVDASRTRPVQIVAGSTRVAIARSRASVIARGGVIQHVSVFAGTVEVSDAGKRHVIVAGATWDRLPEPEQPASSLEAFREGWTLLRAGDHAAAIAAFDRATDPVVAEDAMYWAAVAAERIGKRDEARRRFTDFVARFTSSPRGDAAQAALARLAR